MKWTNNKPVKDGNYLMRSGDWSAWTSTKIVEVQSRQEFGSPCVFENEVLIGCLDDFSKRVSWIELTEPISDEKIEELSWMTECSTNDIKEEVKPVKQVRFESKGKDGTI